VSMAEPDLKRDYEARKPLYEQLLNEVVFILNAALKDHGIKTHGVTGRVKGLPSLEDKAVRNGYTDPLGEASDVVGVRIVTLFLSDLPLVRDLLDNGFDVVESDDKIDGADPSTFGYMSMHYIATLPDSHVGPRYDKVKSIRFEIQVRTMLMDAWANVSHYLAYKGEASVPADLKRDFHALSGLFYVADQHFEMFFKGVMESRQGMGRGIDGSIDSAEVNLETVQSLLYQKYSDREHAPPDAISEFVEEVTEMGYADLEALDLALSRVSDATLADYERERPPHGTAGRRYTDVGAARVSLAIADRRYASAKYDGDGRYARYRKLID
jgi:putative GTP pyrophosphokinase